MYKPGMFVQSRNGSGLTKGNKQAAATFLLFRRKMALCGDARSKFAKPTQWRRNRDLVTVGGTGA